jgi:hypothetical protein
MNTAGAPAEPSPPALVAALAHLAASEAALAAALQAQGGGRRAAPGPGGQADTGLAALAALADERLRPWAEHRPWALVGLAAVAGALLASPRGRGLLGAAALAALLPPPPGRLGPRALGRGLALLLTPRTERRP